MDAEVWCTTPSAYVGTLSSQDKCIIKMWQVQCLGGTKQPLLAAGGTQYERPSQPQCLPHTAVVMTQLSYCWSQQSRHKSVLDIHANPG